MPVEISFTLSDEDLQHFQSIVDKSRTAVEDDANLAKIESAAAKLVEDARESDMPEFIRERLLKLQVLLNMVNDSEWQLTDEERRQIIAALVYFCDPEDVIPDHIPGIGFLDDALYAEVVIRELTDEIASYEEFCQFRLAEENRRRASGQDPHVGREEWLADKRAVLHSRMRSRRSSRRSSGAWSVKLF